MNCKSFAAAVGTTVMVANHVQAGQVINNDGITSPDQVVTFSEFTFPTATPINTQFSSLGVTFSPGLCYNVQPQFFPTQSLASFGCSPSGNNSIFFNKVVGAAAVALQSNPISTTFTALLDGAVVESFTTTTSLSVLPDLTHASDFYGFTGIQFNELRIANSQQVFQIDNLQFRSPPDDEIQQITLAANDIIYDPISRKIYASVPGTAGDIGNTITAIDPFSGTIGSSVFIGSEPEKLAISDDGQFLYVDLDGAAAVRRFNIVTKTAGLQFSLGSDDFFWAIFCRRH